MGGDVPGEVPVAGVGLDGEAGVAGAAGAVELPSVAF